MDIGQAASAIGSDAWVEHLRARHTETEDVILRRRSVRLYKKKQVPDFMIRRILEAGRFAPSAGNGQPWKFVVIRDAALIEELTQSTLTWVQRFRNLIDYRVPGFLWRLPLAKLFIRVKPRDLHPVPFTALAEIADGKLGLYHGAPTIILIFKNVRGISNPDLDCGIAGQNMVLAAHSMGLGTCWVSFSKLAFQYERRWKKRFGIQYPYAFATSLAIGWPVGNPDGRVPRPTHPVDWWEDGTKTVLDPDPAKEGGRS